MIFKESREIYGSYRIQKMLEREGLPVVRLQAADIVRHRLVQRIVEAYENTDAQDSRRHPSDAQRGSHKDQ